MLPSEQKVIERHSDADGASLRLTIKMYWSQWPAFSVMSPHRRRRRNFHLMHCFPQSHAECWENSTSGWNLDS